MFFLDLKFITLIEILGFEYFVNIELINLLKESKSTTPFL